MRVLTIASSLFNALGRTILVVLMLRFATINKRGRITERNLPVH